MKTKPSAKLTELDEILVELDLIETVLPTIEIPIIHEDDNCVVINKPIGVLSHSKGAFNPEATVATWLKPYLKSGYEGDRAGIVHRLDRATSGVMICAKDEATMKFLQKQFSQRRTRKVYLAVVQGHLPHQNAIIDVPLGRNPKKPQTFQPDINGKSAVTEYTELQSSDKYSLVELKPTTGRTHQLRVHLSHLGHPIVGDRLYGGFEAPRLMLHAKKLEITLPGGERRVFESAMPSEFLDIMK